MIPAEYRDRLHACLDARRDPLDDEALGAFLADHPDELERFAALRQRLAALPSSRQSAGERGPRRPSILPLGGMAAAAVIAAITLTRADRGSAAVLAHDNGRVLAASLEALPPRQYAAATFHVRQRFSAGPTMFLETFELRSERR